MDINKVQKLNQMAMNLQKHNIVSDKNQAISNAERLYGMENNFSREEVKQMTDDNPDELRKDVRKLSFALRDALLEIKELKSQMSKVQREFNDIMVNQRPRQAAPVQRPVMQQVEKRQEAPAQQVQTKFGETSKQITAPIDRNNVAPSDVSIEKMFYFGQK